MRSEYECSCNESGAEGVLHEGVSPTEGGRIGIEVGPEPGRTEGDFVCHITLTTPEVPALRAWQSLSAAVSGSQRGRAP